METNHITLNCLDSRDAVGVLLLRLDDARRLLPIVKPYTIGNQLAEWFIDAVEATCDNEHEVTIEWVANALLAEPCGGVTRWDHMRRWLELCAASVSEETMRAVLASADAGEI